VSVTPAGGAAEKIPSTPKVEKGSTNAVAASTPAKPKAGEAIFSQFGLWLMAVTGGLVEQGMWWLYLLLLLLAALILVLRQWARGRKKRPAGPPARFP
jgi:hypothetical protein